jgi:hypothetical protein
MWQPSKPQWAIIVVVFVVFVYCSWMAERTAENLLDAVFGGGISDPLLGIQVSRERYQLVRWVTLVGGLLAVWWLQGRRRSPD